MARKTFLNGYPLPASDLNTYLMDQTVQTFADAAARTAALATPTSGMMSYLADTKQVYTFDGTSWNAQIDAVNQATVLSSRRNYIINGGFDIWQRGTSVAFGAVLGYGADRWQIVRSGWASGATMSRQAGTGNARYAARVQRDSGNTSTAFISIATSIETSDSISLAGKTVTVSFKARAGANFSSASSVLAVNLPYGTGTDQSYIAGYTGNVDNSANVTLTTSWQTFTRTITLNSAATEVALAFTYTPVGTAGAADYFEVDEVQYEVGSVATPFSRAGGTLQGELAACQRYYYRNTPGLTYGAHCIGFAGSATIGSAMLNLPVPMRVAPTSVEGANLAFGNYAGAVFAISSLSLNSVLSNANCIFIDFVSSAMTGGQVGRIGNNNNTAGYLGFNAEL